MKKLTSIIVLLLAVSLIQAQTFNWKELANLNKMNSTEKEVWLLEEKGFVLTDSTDGLTYRNTASKLDEKILVKDSMAIYFWEYEFNADISTVKSTDYIMSKSLALNLNRLYLEQERDEKGEVIFDSLTRLKYKQALSIGSLYNTDGSRTSYAAAEMF